jgi:hypothetical protein
LSAGKPGTGDLVKRARLARKILFGATLAQATRWQIAAARSHMPLSAWMREAAETRWAEFWAGHQAEHGAEGLTPADAFFSSSDCSVQAEALREEDWTG